MPAGVAYHPVAGRNDWNTPAEVSVPLFEFCNGPVSLDPCSNPKSIVEACQTYELPREENGLVLPWFGTTYVNPPFNALRAWAHKAATEARRGTEILFLCPSRTDTKAWHESIATAQAVLFWRGRLRFLGAEGPAPFPVALAYWGPRVARFREVFGPHGLVVLHSV